MSHHEQIGQSDEWYTPKYIFDALDCFFDIDVSAPSDLKYISTPALKFINQQSLEIEWKGFVWLNPPFGGRNGLVPWIDKIITHGNGILLTPDRTSTDWWQNTAAAADAHLQVKGKIKFINQFGQEGKSPSTGTTLFGFGDKAIKALRHAEYIGLGTMFKLYKL